MRPMKTPIEPDAAWEAVDTALRTRPLAPPPAALKRAVMAQVRRLDRAGRPAFRLEWLDVAVGGLGAAGLITLLWGALTLAQLAGAPEGVYLAAWLRLEALRLTTVLGAAPLGLWGLAGAIFAAGALAVAVLGVEAVETQA